MNSDDPFDLQRFVTAQDHGVYERALLELRGGRKQSHWMWFVFPQLAGLGHSATAQRYAIGSLDEARAYVAHPLLGPRLTTCTEAVLGHPLLTAHEIFGHPDDLKFHACMTLFNQVAPAGNLFARVLERFFGGQPHGRTLALLVPEPQAGS